MPEYLSAFEMTLTLLAFAGLSLAAFISLLYFRQILQMKRVQKQLNQENSKLLSELAQVNGLLNSETHVRLVFDESLAVPQVQGAVAVLFPDVLPARLPTFSAWLPPQEALAIDNALAHLRQTGQGFKLELVSLSGKVYEAQGQAIGAQAIICLRLIEGMREEARLQEQRLNAACLALTSYETLFHLIPFPLWLRNDAGKLTLVNYAFAQAVEAPDSATAQLRGSELLDLTARNTIKAAIQNHQPYQDTLRAIAAGQRRLYEVREAPLNEGSAGFALDVTQNEALKKERSAEMEAQRRIFDRLGVALAIFDAQRQLIFYNHACQVLWDLPASLLDDQPKEGDIFDMLRDKGRLPEHPNYREWKRAFLELKANKEQEPREENWYMPDRSSLKITQAVNEMGGFTYLFEDVTQRHEMERKHSALTLLQRETIENLSEAVAVYSSDGRLSLSNEAFAQFWKIDEAQRETRPHIEELNRHAQHLFKDMYPLEMLQGVVTGLQNSRESYATQIERLDGTIIALTASPMPDGGTLTTARDATSEVNAKRLLMERNMALQAANALKSAFVQNVSYEMRSPLTNIIGFTQMLEEGILGEIPPTQKEYLSFILRSSQQLENVIDSILDFAALETGALALTLRPFEIKAAMLAAIDGVRGKRAQDNIKIIVETSLKLGKMQGDERRIKQVFTALLSNAIGFSSSNGKILFRAERLNAGLRFTIKDDGPGISDAQRGQIFEAFTSFSAGTGHRGMGLGLSLAKSLVELHGGLLAIANGEEQGTIVTLTFPLTEALNHVA
jgi:signal transduction histidine kinase